MVISGRKRRFGRKGSSVLTGLAKNIKCAETVYVESSSSPRPQGGSREPIANSSGPAMLMGPTGPERYQFLFFFSLSQMVTSARSDPDGVLTTTLFSPNGSKKPVWLSCARDRRSKVS